MKHSEISYTPLSNISRRMSSSARLQRHVSQYDRLKSFALWFYFNPYPYGNSGFCPAALGLAGPSGSWSMEAGQV